MFAQIHPLLSRTLLAGSVTLSTLSASPAQAQASTDGRVLAGPSEAVLQWQHAVEAGDAQAIARMNGPDTVAYPPDTPRLQGREAIAAAYAGMFDKYTAQVEIQDTHYLRHGALLNSWGLYVLTLTPKAGGQPLRMEGRFSDLAVHEGGQWRYVVDHASLPVR